MRTNIDVLADVFDEWFRINGLSPDYSIHTQSGKRDGSAIGNMGKQKSRLT